MSIGPRKKISIAKKNQRHATREKLTLKKITNRLSLMLCKNCGKAKRTHHVCLSCGYYADKQVLTIKTKGKNKIVEA